MLTRTRLSVKDSFGVAHGLTERTEEQKAMGIRPPCLCGEWIHLEHVDLDWWYYVCGGHVRWVEDHGTNEARIIWEETGEEQPQYGRGPGAGVVW